MSEEEIRRQLDFMAAAKSDPMTKREFFQHGTFLDKCFAQNLARAFGDEVDGIKRCVFEGAWRT